MRRGRPRQERLFTLPVDESKLGRHQQAVLRRIDLGGSVSAREAGSVVYRNRGYRDPLRVDADWRETAGLRVLLSLKRRGLVYERRADNRWARRVQPSILMEVA